MASIRGALDALGADRLRHGIRVVDDPALLGELATRGVVCDVCPVSNLRTARSAVAEHPLPAMRRRRACCARSAPTTRRCSTPISAGSTRPRPSWALTAEDAFRAGVAGVLCDDDTRAGADAHRRHAPLAAHGPK